MTNTSVKLPDNIVTIPLPPMQDTGATTTLAGSTRITEQLNTRVTRGGNTRVTRNYTIHVQPELVVVKLADGVISLPVPTE